MPPRCKSLFWGVLTVERTGRRRGRGRIALQSVRRERRRTRRDRAVPRCRRARATDGHTPLLTMSIPKEPATGIGLMMYDCTVKSVLTGYLSFGVDFVLARYRACAVALYGLQYWNCSIQRSIVFRAASKLRISVI